jgi:hypothetical protein
MSTPQNEGYSLRLVWEWPDGRHPGRRALDGLQLLLRFLGFEPALLAQTAASCELRLHPREHTSRNLMAALRRLYAWEESVLREYPGTEWRIGVELAPRAAPTARPARAAPLSQTAKAQSPCATPNARSALRAVVPALTHSA